MAYHIQLLKKVKKQGEMPLPSLGPGVEYDRPFLNPFCFSEKIFCFLYVILIVIVQLILGYTMYQLA